MSCRRGFVEPVEVDYRKMPLLEVVSDSEDEDEMLPLEPAYDSDDDGPPPLVGGEDYEGEGPPPFVVCYD